MEKSKNRTQSFMEGVMTLFFAQVIIKILGLLYRLVITNVDGFGDEGNGLYGAGYQIYTLLLAIASLGVPSAISKLVSERLAVGKHKEAHDVFKVALLLFGIIGLVGSLGLFFGAEYIAVHFIGNVNVTGVMKALSPAVFFVAISAVIRGYFNGMYNMKASSHSQMLEQLFKSSFTIMLVLLVHFLATTNPTTLAKVLHISEENATIQMAVAANFASTLATICSFAYLIIFYMRRKKGIHEEIEKSTGTYTKYPVSSLMKTILKLSIPISLASIVSAINRNIDTVTVMSGLKTLLLNLSLGENAVTIMDMIRGTSSLVANVGEEIVNEANRLYGILSGKIDMLIGLPPALNAAFATALVPTISNAIAKKDVETAKRRTVFSLRLTLLIALPCAFGMAFLAEPIMLLLFPNAIAVEAPIILRISAWIIILTLVNQTVGGVLQGFGKVMVPAVALACGAVVKVIVNLLLIPRIGVYGAPIGSLACLATAMIIERIVLHKHIKLEMNYMQALIKPVLLCLFMGVTANGVQYLLASILHRPSIATLLAIIYAVIVYLLGIIVLKVFDKSDYYMLPYGEKIYHFLQKIKLVKPTVDKD